MTWLRRYFFFSLFFFRIFLWFIEHFWKKPLYFESWETMNANLYWICANHITKHSINTIDSCILMEDELRNLDIERYLTSWSNPAQAEILLINQEKLSHFIFPIASRYCSLEIFWSFFFLFYLKGYYSYFLPPKLDKKNRIFKNSSRNWICP